MRYCNILIAPSRLREEEIDLDIHCSGLGDMIITKPRQYHAVVNFSSCFARSINFLLPGEEPLPEKLLVCKDCGLYPLHPKHYPVQVVGAVERLPQHTNKRKATDSQRNTRTSSALTRKINQTVEVIKHKDPMCSIQPCDATDFPKPNILKLAAAIWSLLVVLQFTSFVKARRARHIGQTIPKGTIRLEALKQEAKCLFDAEAKSELHGLRVRLCQYALAREVDASKTWQRRVSSDLIDKIAGKCK